MDFLRQAQDKLNSPQVLIRAKQNPLDLSGFCYDSIG